MNTALILTGGLGTRLRPLTYAVPKPLLPIGDKPILEIIIYNLKRYGINNIYLSVNYKKELIKAYFGNGEKLGVKIFYIEESKILGTAGSLGLLKSYIKDSFLVMNGDLYTDINIKKMFEFHKSKNSKFTIGAKNYSNQLSYGVLTSNKEFELESFVEKPQFTNLINCGIYMCEPEIIDAIPLNERLDMPDLWNRIQQKLKFKIHIYKFDENWIDIGDMQQYLKLQNELEIGI